MPNYFETKRQLERALKNAEIDINFYHAVCSELDKSLANATMTHYIDANKNIALSK